MLVFIDESGDPGMKLHSGSSRFFIVTLLAFEDDGEALAADERIGQLKRELKLASPFEFHFNKLRPDFRKSFLVAISPYDWFYFSVVIDKEKLKEKGLPLPSSFHRYACGLVFDNAKPYLHNATVVIDGSGSRHFRRELSGYLRQRTSDPDTGAGPLLKVKLQDSGKNHLLQMADIVCGAVARSFTHKADAGIYRILISRREMNVEIWPK